MAGTDEMVAKQQEASCGQVNIEAKVPTGHFGDKQRADENAVYLFTAIDVLCANQSITAKTAAILQRKVHAVLMFIRGLNG